MDRDKQFAAWLKTRPEKIRELAGRHPPFETYRIKSTGQLCTLASYSEFKDGGVGFMVDVLPGQGIISSMLFPDGHRVFGLKDGDLEPVLEGDGHG